MAIDLYYLDDSPPCEAVMLVAKALGVKLNLIFVDLWKEEHLKPDFLKINPQHTVPLLVDNGLIIAESRAIMCYLVEKYGKDDSLYPKDPRKRAIVNARLYYDMGTLYQRFTDLHFPMMFNNAPYDPEKKKKLDESYDILNQFLANSPWVAGDTVTIADMTVAVSVANSVGVTGYNITPYPNVVKWYNVAKSSLQGFEEIVESGIRVFNDILDERNYKRIHDE